MGGRPWTNTNACGTSGAEGQDLELEVKESLTRHSSRNGTVEGGDGGHGHLLWSILLGAGMPSGHHVGLQQRALQVHMMVIQGLVDSSQDLKDKRSKPMKPRAALESPALGSFMLHGCRMMEFSDVAWPKLPNQPSGLIRIMYCKPQLLSTAKPLRSAFRSHFSSPNFAKEETEVRLHSVSLSCRYTVANLESHK